MFAQLLTPVGDSLLLSFIVAALPVAVVLVLLGVLRRPAWQASLGRPGRRASSSPFRSGPSRSGSRCIPSPNGVVFALWPVMWIVFNALLLYNIAVESGRFDAFRDWVHRPAARTTVASCWS